jgi:hypothetical protein
MPRPEACLVGTDRGWYDGKLLKERPVLHLASESNPFTALFGINNRFIMDSSDKLVLDA